MVGFIEAEGSFYLTSKDSTRIVHGFGLTQKLDRIVLEGIKLILHIPTSIRYKSNHNHYILDTTNSRAIENIIEYFHNTMKGMKSLEYGSDLIINIKEITKNYLTLEIYSEKLRLGY